MEFSYSAYKIQAPDTRILHLCSKFPPSARVFLHAYLHAPQVVYICRVCIPENQYTFLSINDLQLKKSKNRIIITFGDLKEKRPVLSA